MRLLIRGQCEKVTRKEIKYAANWFASKLMSRQLLRYITVEIHFVKLRGFRGMVSWEDDAVKPRHFNMEIHYNLNRKQTLLTIAHEMVHVKQYAKGELRDYGIGYTKWRKEFVSTEDIHYYDLPWEIEAHGREEGLYVRYQGHLAIEGLTF